MNMQHLAYIGLGSNLEAPDRQVCLAFAALAASPDMELVARSSLYLTAPIGDPHQPDFVNAVAQVRTALAPHDLLDLLLAIERGQGRVRGRANASRTLDLDILLYDDLSHADPKLHVPHPRAHQRAFVLYPLLEIAPDCVIPGRGLARDWLPAVDDQIIARLPYPARADEC
jgi:2-amino-4-hydroxy-6-hydroxymethyldihydropteridine diphosphokinase